MRGCTVPAGPERHVRPFILLYIYPQNSALVSPSHCCYLDFSFYIVNSFISCHQSVCEGGCLRPRLPWLRPVLGEHRWGVRRPAHLSEWLHNNQQRGWRCLVSNSLMNTKISKYIQRKKDRRLFDLPQAVGMLPSLRPLLFFLTRRGTKVLGSLVASGHAYGLNRNVTRLVTWHNKGWAGFFSCCLAFCFSSILSVSCFCPFIFFLKQLLFL